MDLWQKLTIDWPCMLGDWLWANIRVPLATLPQQLTMRRVVFVVVLLVAAAALAQLVTADAAWFPAGDLAFYCGRSPRRVAFIVVRGTCPPIRCHAARNRRVERRGYGARRCGAVGRIGAGRHRDVGRPVRHAMPTAMTRGLVCRFRLQRADVSLRRASSCDQRRVYSAKTS